MNNHRMRWANDAVLKTARMVICATLLLSACSESRPADSDGIVFTNVHVVDVAGGGVPELRTVTVVDGVIASIDEPGDTRSHRGYRTVDGGGGYLAPGLIDAHTHVRNKSNLPLYVVNGVTTVRDMNGSPAQLRWRSLIAESKIVGPHLLVASPITTSDSNIYWRQITSVTEAKGAVGEYVREGYDFVKIYELATPVLEAVLSEAAVRGIGVVGHYPIRGAFKTDSVEFERTLLAGMTSIEHLEELFSLAKVNSTGGSIDGPTEILRRSAPPLTTILVRKWNQNRMSRLGSGYLDEERLYQITHYLGPTYLAEVRESIAEDEASALEGIEADTTDVDGVLGFLKALHDGGVLFALGTDSHSPVAIAGFAVHEELALYLQAGLSPLDALRIATINGATMLGLGDRTGSITAGKRADMVLLAANPLEHLSTLKSPRGVMVGGRWFDLDELTRMRDVL